MSNEHDAPRRSAPIGRRVLLSTLGLGAAGLAAAPALRGGWERLLSTASQYDPTGLTGLLPNPGGFRYYSVASAVPHKDATDYRLTVGGLVERPRTHSLADLQAMQQTRAVHDVKCTDGWGVADTAFEGVKLSALLDAAGVRPEGRAIRFTCFDGVYSESLTMEQARRPDVLIALKMLDKPVTHEHGGPVRLFVAPMYFYKSAKWLSGITVTDRVIPGYWEDYGYDVDGWLPGADRYSADSGA
jgi:DMSO/TMAO reductase YedYZ molybdopterin-dependent catalytic subunit